MGIDRQNLAKFDDSTKRVDTTAYDSRKIRQQQMAEIDRIRAQQDRARTEQSVIFCPYCGRNLAVGVHFCDTT